MNNAFAASRPNVRAAEAARARLYCAADTASIAAALRLGVTLKDAVGGLKLGLEYFFANGAQGVDALRALGLPIFLDLKLHDIPNTVAGAIRAIARLDPVLLTIHAAGGGAMIQAAVAAVREAEKSRTKIIAVTALTSLDESDLAAVGFAGSARDVVRRLADVAIANGADGVVCAPTEVAALRAQCGPDFLLVVPGIRAAGQEVGDQKRTLSAGEAIAAGASYLVVGRPITQAPDPTAAARALVAEIAAAAGPRLQ